MAAARDILSFMGRTSRAAALIGRIKLSGGGSGFAVKWDYVVLIGVLAMMDKSVKYGPVLPAHKWASWSPSGLSERLSCVASSGICTEHRTEHPLSMGLLLQL